MLYSNPLSRQTAVRVNRVLSVLMLVGLVLQTTVAFNPVAAQAAAVEPANTGSEFSLAADTGFLSPTADSQNGDNDSWSTPTSAYGDGSGAATDNEGDRHQYLNFNITLPPLATVDGIEVKVDAWSTDASGCRLDVDLSWNDGSSRTNEKQQLLTGTETTYTLGGATDDWGHTWTSSQLSNANFQLRVQDADPGSNCDNSATSNLDWVRLKVHYTAAEITPNPSLPNSCGLDLGLVIDSSSSISNTELTQMKNAYKAFVDAFLPGTPTQFSVVEYDTNVVPPSLAFTSTIATIKNRIDAAVSSNYTNWEAGLYASHNLYDPRPAKPNLMLFASDGNPNTNGVAGNSDGGAAGEAAAMTSAIARANAIKAAGIRILALGIGDDLNVDNLKAISGNNVNTGVTSDVITSNFSTLAADLAQLANDLCGGKILVQKTYDTNGDGQADLDGSVPNAALAGWNFDVNGSPSNPVAQTTTNTGSLEFSVLNGTYSVTETALKPGTALVTAACTKGQNAVGTFDPQTRTVTGLSLTTDETISCTFLNQTVNGSLRVIKQVVGGDAQSSDWQIHVQQQGSDIPNSPQPGSTTGTDYTVTAGSYVVSETGGPSGYTLSFSGDCTDHGFVTVPAGGSATCTLTNTRDQGRIKIVKVVDDQSNPGAWTFNVAGHGIVNHNTFFTVNTGDYGVTESGPAGYALDHVEGTCSMGPNGITLHVTSQGGTCTVYNRHLDGDLTVCKVVDTNGDGNIANDPVFTGGWSMTLDDNTANEVTQQTGQNGCTTFTDVSPGTHTVTEATVAGWVRTYPTSNTQSVEIVDGQTTLVKFGNTKLGSIEGYKWSDLNGNASRDCKNQLALTIGDYACEPVLSDWTITLWQDQALVATTTTDQTGSYSFSDVMPGTYLVCEEQQNGWQQTFPNTNNGCHQVTIVSGDTADGLNFGNQELGEIDGYKWNDLNGNHEWDHDCQLDLKSNLVIGNDECEPVLGGWTIQLKQGDTVIATAVTDQGGHYHFSNVVPGDYQICEVQQNGWQQSYPLNDGCHTVTVDAGEECHFNFGNIERGSITGHKFEQVGQSHNPLTNWVITLSRSNGEGYDLVDDTLTNQSGSYAFQNLLPGHYKVCEVIPQTIGFGWLQLTPNEPDCYLVTVTSGTHATDKDFVNQKLTPDLSVTKTDGLTTAQPGQTITYTIVVSNVGTWVADNVSVNDTLPAQATYVSSTLDGSNLAATVTPNASGDVLTWANIGSIAPGASKTLAVTVTLDALFPAGTTAIVNTVQVQTTGQDNNPGNNGASDTTSVSAAPVLSITKAADVASVPAGSNIPWTISWSVAGTAMATNVVITDPIPANTTFVSAADGGVYDAVTNTITWNLGVKNPGTSGQVHAVVKTLATLTSTTTITNTATIDSLETDPKFASATANVTVIQVLEETAAPKLTITKAASKAFANRGDQVEYTVVVTNTGDATAVNATVTDTLPKGFTFNTNGKASLTFTLGALAPGEKRTFTYLVNIGATAAIGKNTNLAVAKADGVDPVTARADVSVRAIQVLGETGVGLQDWMLFLFGLIVLAFGSLLYRREYRRLNV